ncbi:MAG: hypothetical protein ABW157_13570 [Candidatus Thiodiazotropha sp. LLP2]
MSKTTAQKKLITVSGKTALTAATSPPDYIRKLVSVPDRKLAAEFASEQASLEFDAEDGKDIPRLEAEKEELDERYMASRQQMEQLEHKRKNTKRYIKRQNEESKPFSTWALKDQLSTVLLGLALVAVMGMGAANTFANLMASGEPVFLDRPWLAVTLSALVPCGSMALKFISHFFDHAVTKKRYALGVYVLTIIAILAWCVNFSINFTGVTGGMDWDALGESDGGKGPLLVFLQIACEILIAAALFLAIEEVSLTYNPPAYDDNPEFIEIDKAFKAHKPDHEKLVEHRNRVTSTLAILKNTRQQHVNNRLLDFHALISSRNI